MSTRYQIRPWPVLGVPGEWALGPIFDWAGYGPTRGPTAHLIRNDRGYPDAMKSVRLLLALALALGETPAVWAAAKAPTSQIRAPAPLARVVLAPVVTSPVVTVNISVSAPAAPSMTEGIRLSVWAQPPAAAGARVQAQARADAVPVTASSSRGLAVQGTLRRVAGEAAKDGEGVEAAAETFDGAGAQAARPTAATVSLGGLTRWLVPASAALSPATAMAQTAAPASAAGAGASALTGVFSAPLLPLGYAYYEMRRSKDEPKPAKAGLLRWAAEWFEAGMVMPMAMGVAAFASWLSRGGSVESAVVASILGIGAAGIESILGQSRSVVVGGWQASHDMKMRVGPDGNLRDVRGTHKRYGEDRYDATAPGPVSARERFAARALAVMAGLPWFASWQTPDFWIYSAVMTGIFVLSDSLRRGRKPFVPSAEDREHARRFSRD